jgi:hypothetical protein
MWIEIPVSNHFNLLLDNHYSAPGCNVKITENDFNFLEDSLNTHYNRLGLLGDFKVSNYDWSNETQLPMFYYYNTIEGNLIHTTVRFLGLNQ